MLPKPFISVGEKTIDQLLHAVRTAAEEITSEQRALWRAEDDRLVHADATLREGRAAYERGDQDRALQCMTRATADDVWGDAALYLAAIYRKRGQTGLADHWWALAHAEGATGQCLHEVERSDTPLGAFAYSTWPEDPTWTTGVGPGGRVLVTAGPHAGHDGTVWHHQDQPDDLLWIAVDGEPEPATVRRVNLLAVVTVADHRENPGPACAIPWMFPEQGVDRDVLYLDQLVCRRPGRVVLRDASGLEMVACAEHEIRAVTAFGGKIWAFRAA